MTQDFKQLSPSLWAAPQINAGDIAQAVSMGISVIICNRPDGEAPGQPEASQIEAAAREHGLEFAYLPMGASGLSYELLDAFDAARGTGAPRPTLAYCASGTRSAVIAAYAAARAGGDVDTLIEASAKAGFNLEGQRSGLLQIFAQNQVDS